MIKIIITKNDCVLALLKLKADGIDVNAQLTSLLKMQEPTLEIIKFINDNREYSIRAFYEKMRKSYNDKHSKLYINLMKCNELEPKEVLCTLGSLQLQILLFNKTQDDLSFLTHARFEDISKCLIEYYRSKDIIPSQKLLSIIKADIKIWDELNNELY